MTTASRRPVSSGSIPLIGLVGGVGSGKSTVGRGLAARMQIAVLDADQAGHKVLQLPEVKAALAQRFGDGIIAPTGEVVRSALAQLVFGSDEVARRNRTDLEQIVHPVIRQQLRQELAEYRRAGQCEAVLLDAALLLESGWQAECDAVVFIDTPAERRRIWTAQSRNWTSEEHDRREASQWTLDKKRAAADFVVSNSGDLAVAVDQLESIVRGIIARESGSR